MACPKDSFLEDRNSHVARTGSVATLEGWSASAIGLEAEASKPMATGRGQVLYPRERTLGRMGLRVR